MRARVLNWIGFINVALVFLYMLFIFLVGTKQQFVPKFLISSINIRNFFISGTHTIGAVFAILYFLHFLDASLYDRKMAAIGIVNTIIYLLALVLVWYCYIIRVTDPLMFVVAVDGILMSILLWILAYAKYSAMDNGVTKSGGAMLKILAFSSTMCFLVGIGTYYGFTGKLLNSMFNMVLPTKSADALSIFLYLVAIALQGASFAVMHFLDVKNEEYIEMLKEKYRRRKQI